MIQSQQEELPQAAQDRTHRIVGRQIDTLETSAARSVNGAGDTTAKLSPRETLAGLDNRAGHYGSDKGDDDKDGLHVAIGVC
jgi:hypothetical protein